MKNKTGKRALALLLCALLTLVSGCTPLILEKNTLYEVSEDDIKNNDDSYFTASLKITDKTELFKGMVLTYDAKSNTALYYNSQRLDDGSEGSQLYVMEGSSLRSLNLIGYRHLEARIDSERGAIYYKERDNSQVSSIYETDYRGEMRTLLTTGTANNYLAWCLSELGTFVYVDEQNRIIRRNDDSQELLYELPKEYAVKKLAYCEGEGLIMLSAATSATSTILYRLSVDTGTLSSIDVNVSDFSVSYAAKTTAYIKANSSGADMIYTYSHVTLLRRYYTTANIDKLTISPSGSYIAYVSKITEGLPTQSIVIVSTQNNAAIKLTTTGVASGVFWTLSERALIYTTNEAGTADTAQTLYTTYKIEFAFEYKFDKKPDVEDKI